MRRIIAEDPEWNLATVPHLANLCLKNIIKNFAENPVVNELPPKHKAQLLQHLDVKIPLSVTANLIDDEDYWKRCCKNVWAVADVSLCENTWKRMFFERNLEDAIERFVPGTTPFSELQELLKLSQSFVKRLDIKQLLPPIKQANETADDELSDTESDSGENCSSDHLDVGALLGALPRLEELHITYGVRQCGMNFEWNLFEFTSKDCEMLAKALRACHQLKLFHCHKSKVNDEKARMLVSHLLDHPMLQTLNFSYNKLNNGSARAIGKLLNGHSQLVSLDLTDNHIGADGAGAIAYALRQNCTLKHLNMRLNSIGDEGCEMLCKSLLINSTLTHLNVGSNNLAQSSGHLICQVLANNKTLLELDLSCNSFQEKGGKSLEEGMEDNSSIVHMDLRLCDISLECMHNINQLLKRNKEISRNKKVPL